jgi:hypothetical protein
MSAPRLCLRCDWEGEIDAMRCPVCGAPLFRPAASASRDRRGAAHLPTGAPAGPATGDLSPRRADAYRTPAEEPHVAVTPRPTTRARATALAVAAALVMTGSAFAWIQAHTPPPAAPATGLKGTLVYAVPVGDDWARLWRWDLGSDTVAAGPKVRDPVELVNAYGPGNDWVGITSRLSDGRFSAGILPYQSPNDDVTPLLSADMVAWGARGEGVAGVSSGRAAGCHRRVQVRYAALVPRRTDVQVDRPICGMPLSIGRDDARTYLTLRRAHEARVVFAGLDRFHFVLAHHVLASVSPAADLLVVPGAAVPSSLALPETSAPANLPTSDPRNAHDPLGAVTGTAMYFRGLSGGRPIPYGVGTHPFTLDRALAWSPDAGDVLVVGRVDRQWGLYQLGAGPSPGRRAPKYLGAVQGQIFATYADDGTGYVLNGTDVSTLVGGQLAPLALPPGAPAPNGPIVWIR